MAYLCNPRTSSFKPLCPESNNQTGLSIYLPIRLNPRRGHQKGSKEPSAVVSFCLFVSYCAMLVVLVVSKRRASACLIMLSGKQGSHLCHFYDFGMARPGLEPTSSRSRSSTICAIRTVFFFVVLIVV